MTKLQLEQLGNFYGFFIPNDILEELGFFSEENFELHVDKGSLIISKPGDYVEEKAIELTDDDLDAWSSCLEDM